MKLLSLIISFSLLIFSIYSQDSIYFNNVYQQNNNFSVGMTILETEDGYIGYGGTEDPGNIGQMLLLFKIDKQGEEMIWKPFGENYHSYYYGNVGGAMIKTNDGNFALAYHAANNGIGYSTLLKLNSNLDTLWKKNYTTENYWTLSMNAIQTADKGYILTGSAKPGTNDFWDVLALKTDSLGNMQWYQSYGTGLQEQGESIIETPDGGYLIGGFRYNPPVYHSLDALVIKTDSLGNEEWTKTYGNPYVDDDMAHVALADDGNFLIATVYGEWIVSPGTRTGRIYLVKVNNEGTTIWQQKIAPKMYHCNIRNIRETINGDIVATGFYYPDTTTDFILNGWFYKFNQEGDSIWFRDYYHYFDQYAENLLYDVCPCQDKGYIGIGYARPGAGGSTEKMWVIKVDSMGCDTAGCATGTFTKEYSLNFDKKITAYPNPASSEITLTFQNTDHHTNMLLECYNIYGQSIHAEKIWKGQQQTKIDLQGWAKGLYFAVIKSNQKVAGTCRFIKK
jgi:hypothetical protein